MGSRQRGHGGGAYSYVALRSAASYREGDAYKVLKVINGRPYNMSIAAAVLRNIIGRRTLQLLAWKTNQFQYIEWCTTIGNHMQ